MLTIDNQPVTHSIPLLNLGFRPFFLLAGIFAVFATLLWTAVYLLGWQLTPYGVSAMTWHAHEMIYGYALAVVAGFLLTAVSNWTSQKTLSDIPLLLLVILWILGRVFPLLGESIPVVWVAVIDNAFAVILLWSICLPIIRARQWSNLAVVSILLLLLISNLIFYAGAISGSVTQMNTGLYAGMYIILALIFVMGRRVIPFFIEKGVGYPVVIKNWHWLDISILIAFALFVVSDLWFAQTAILLLTASIVFLLQAIRLYCWYTAGIWKKPLLWILYLGYAFLVLGFALKVASLTSGVSPYLSIHAFTYGGIGMITIGMMARVALGHTGRNVFDPPPVLFWMFFLITAGAIFRVILPLFFSGHYYSLIATAELFWALSFILFVIVYGPMLLKPRTDGRFG